MCPKIHTEKKEYESPEEVQVLKILISTGDSYFKIQSLKVGINRQPLLRRCRMVVVCGKEVTGTMNTEISMADRLHIICTTLDGLVQIKESK